LQKGEDELKIVYTTPEQLEPSSPLRKYLERHNVDVKRLVVDEAHVVVQWETFRFEALTCEHCCPDLSCTNSKFTVMQADVLQVSRPEG
jgi:superfamily II DNA helicase RecQ